MNGIARYTGPVDTGSVDFGNSWRTSFEAQSFLERTTISEEAAISRSELLALTGEIVSAFLANNLLARSEVAPVIQSVFETLSALATDEAQPSVELTSAVPIRRSVTDDYLACLEDGKKLKMLNRHLMTAYGVTPDEYRAKWGLRSDYPMVAPSYSRKRHELAKEIGLGRKPANVAPQPAPKASRTRRRPAA